MKKYKVQRIRRLDVEDERLFWTAAGLIRFIRKQIEHFPKMPFTVYTAYIKHSGKWIEVLKF